jgi:hypothetical protein
MAQKLDNRPGQVYDPEDKSPKPSNSSDNQYANSGIDQLESFANDPKNASNPDIRNLEKNASLDDGNTTDTTANEKARLQPAEEDSFYSNDDDKPGRLQALRGKITKKRSIVGGAVTGGIVSVLVSGFVAFPTFMVNQISDIITGKTGEVQLDNTLKYRRKNFHKLTDVFSRDGRLGGRMIAEMEELGYDVRFGDTTDPNKITGIRKPGTNRIVEGEELGDVLVEFQDIRHPVRLASLKTRRMEAFYTRYGVSRKSIVTPEAGVGRNVADPKTETNRRLHESIEGEEVETSSQRTGSVADDSDEVDIDNADADATARNSGVFSDLNEYASEGKDLDTYPDQALVRAWRQSGGLPGVEILQEAEDSVTNGSLGGKAFSTIKGIGLSTDLADKVCIIKQRLRTAMIAARNYRALSMMRYALVYVTASDGVRKGEAQADLLREVMLRAVQPDSSGNYFGSSSGIQHALSGKFSKSRNDVTRSSYSVDGKYTAHLKQAQEKSNISGCEVWQNPYFQVGAAAAEIAITVLTFGGGKAVLSGAREAVEFGFKASLRSAIQSSIFKSVARGVAISAITELSFEGIMALMQIYAERSLTANFLAQEQGALLGEILTGGGGAVAKQRALSAGQVPAETTQYLTAYNEYQTRKKETIQTQSVFTRFFDRNNTDSLAFNTASHIAVNLNSPQSATNSISESIFSAPTNIASTLMNMAGGKSYAQAVDLENDLIPFDSYTTIGDNSGLELAIDHAGNLQTFMPDAILNIDPITNRDELLANGYINADEEPIGEFAEHVENCVYAIDTITTIETKDQTDPATDCLAQEVQTQKYKAHLAYLDMKDSVEATFAPEEISQGGLEAQFAATGPGATSLSAPGLNGYAIPCQGLPTAVIRVNNDDAPHADWSSIPSSGVIGTGSDGNPINVYIREPCAGATDVKTVFIASSVHGSESGGQLISHELLFNEDIPDNIRIVAVPEINKFGITFRDSNGYGGRVNSNGVNINRNFDYRWATLPGDVGGDGNNKGPTPSSEPETQALVNFVQSIPIDLALHYHDNIQYVAAVGNSTPISLAQTYGNVSSTTPIRPAEGGRVFQRGSFDGWQNESLGTPALLIEMAQDQSPNIIQQHVDAVKAVLLGGGF